MIEITPLEVNELVEFVEANFGINLARKQQLIQARLQPILAEKGFSSFKQYIDLVKKKDPADIDRMLIVLTTNHTYFMRETEHFDYFRDIIIPTIAKKSHNKTLAIWSAGCSSGEEPYTLSMILADHFGSDFKNWDTRILATDISLKALGKAQKATYHADGMSDVPIEWKNKYFIKKGDFYEVAPMIKNNVIFRQFNLMDNINFKLDFDVIFCRNVMIYFNADVKDQLVERFYKATKPGGYLLIGHSENINKNKSKYKTLIPAAFVK